MAGSLGLIYGLGTYCLFSLRIFIDLMVLFSPGDLAS